MSRKALVAFAAAAVFAASAAVMADVIVYPDGSAFVGKGDVQSAFGWNNAQLQANASGVTFSAELSQTFTQECFETGGPPTTVYGYRNGVSTLNATVSHSPRVHHQIDGFWLDSPTTSGVTWSDIVWIGGGSGDPGGSGCPGGPSVSHPGGPPVAGPIEFDAIYAHFGGQSVQIYP